MPESPTPSAVRRFHAEVARQLAAPVPSELTPSRRAADAARSERARRREVLEQLLEEASPSEFERIVGGAVSHQAPRSDPLEGYYPGSQLPARPDIEAAVQRELEQTPPVRAPAAPGSEAAPTPRLPPVRVGAPRVPIEVDLPPPPTARSPRPTESPAKAPARPVTPVPERQTDYQGRVDACTKEVLSSALVRTGGNKRRAARELNMSRSGFYKALGRVGLPTAGR